MKTDAPNHPEFNPNASDTHSEVLRPTSISNISPSKKSSSANKSFTDKELWNIANNCIDGVQNEADKNFAVRKWDNLLLADSFGRLGFEDVQKRVRGCASFMTFKIDLNNLNSNNYQRLSDTFLCSNPLCPLCQWRKTLKKRNQLKAVLNHLDGEN
jgi:hypothetical protein